MKNTGKCTKCGGRRLLHIDELRVQRNYQVGETLHLCLLQHGQVGDGKLRMIACCKCGFVEWYAESFGATLREFGELYPGVKVVDGDFADAVAALGLVETAGATFAGWKFLAQGSIEDVPILVGERVDTRILERGQKNVMRVEVRARARVDLGSFAIRHPGAVGLTPNLVYRQVVRTGEADFDGARLVVCLEPVDPAILALAARGDTPTVRIPWLDAEVRTKLTSATIEELLVVQNDIRVVLPEYDPDSLSVAVDLALQLARWKGVAEHPYR